MRTVRVTALLLCSMLASALAPVPAAAGGPITWTWPNGTCSGTLQQCVTNASSEDTIEISTNAVVDERPTWQDKSLTLRAGPGFTPTIGKGLAFAATTGTRTVVIRGLRFEGEVDLLLQGGTGHQVDVRNITIRVKTGGAANHGLYIPAGVPATISVRQVTIVNPRNQGGGLLFDGSNDTGTVRFSLIGSRISGRGNAGSGPGIGLYARGDGGTVEVDVHNTVVHDVARCDCGGAVGVELLGGATAQARFRLVGLTIDRSATAGLSIDDRMDAGGHMAVWVFNSIISRSAEAGVVIGALVDATLDVRAGYNAYHANGPNRLAGRSLGAHNVVAAPRYVDPAAGNLRLRADSPLIDRGQVCSRGRLANPDADGHDRVAGRSIDMGAYERGGAAVPGEIRLSGDGPSLMIGTPGRDIMCGYGGDDELEGAGGPDFLDGGPGGDFLAAGTGRDRLFGGRGPDTLCAIDGAGDDRVDGGPDSDRFGVDPGDQRTAVEVKATCPGLPTGHR